MTWPPTPWTRRRPNTDGKGVPPMSSNFSPWRPTCPEHGEDVQRRGCLPCRVWSKVDARGPDECWDWTGARTSNGYGLIRVGGQKRNAHAVVLELVTDEAANGPCGPHGPCDRPICVNPRHLRWGSNADNVADRVERERSATGDRSGARLHPEAMPRGERHGLAKLTADLVRELRRQRAEGVSWRRLGQEFG